MVVWSVLVLAAVLLADAAVPDPPDVGATAAGNLKLTTAADCTGIVAFSATGGIIDNSRVVLAELLVNKGRADYSTRTGIFTVNCPGLYQFSFAGYGTIDLILQLKRKPKNGSWKTIAVAGPSGGGANTILLDVNFGDQLAVFVYSGELIAIDATFTGYRLDWKQ